MDWLPVPALGGVNLFDDPRAIRDEEVQLARNLVPARPGILKKRGGLSRPLATYSFDSGERPVVAMISPIRGSPVDAVVATSEINQSASRFFGVSVDNTAVGFFNTLPFWASRPHVLSWANKAYLLPGPYATWAGPSGHPFYVMQYKNDPASDFTEVVGLPFTNSATSPTGNATLYPTYAFPYKNRLVLANFGQGYENTILFTNDFRADQVGPDALFSNTRSISLVAGADGDEIVAGIEVMLTNVGSPAESGLLILRRYGDPFLLTGDMDQVADDGTPSGTTTLNIKRISVQTGCAGQYTVARTPVGIIWAGTNDVWCFAAGVLPHRLGQKIQPALKLTPAQLQYRWSATYFDGFYRLAVWGAGQGMTASDAPGDQWWLDLRDGLPQDWREARWWGPQQFLGGAGIGTAPVPGIWCMFPETRAGKTPRLFYVDWAITSWPIGEFGAETRDLTADPSTIADADYVDPEVTAELITKEYALSPGRDQINDGLMMVLRPSNDLTISADFIIDDGDQVLTRTKRLADTTSFQLDSSPLDASASAVGPLTGKALKTALYPPTRRAGQTHRFRIYDTAGWTIAAGVNDTLVVQIQDSVATGITYQWIATVAPGTYSISALATAVATAINAGKLFGNAWGLTATAGIYTLTGGGPYATGMTMAVKFAGTTLTPPDVGTAATQAQLDACRRLMGILGFDNTGTNRNNGPALSPAIAGDTAPFKKGVSDWEIYGISANMEVLPRTP